MNTELDSSYNSDKYTSIVVESATGYQNKTATMMQRGSKKEH
ncbi:hypothetical protein NJ7G_2319 [Natrinema sp. J7-2]|nr:hypothetical protein NJ7G_2319 [Natrinema sp. J7-2]